MYIDDTSQHDIRRRSRRVECIRQSTDAETVAEDDATGDDRFQLNA